MIAIHDILKKCDHTLLSQNATAEEILTAVEDGIRYNTASVCLPPVYVKEAKAFAAGRIPICTVIGFPHGYHATEVKLFETERALSDGADEIDTVICIGHLKDRRYDEILSELTRQKALCGDRILKVIIETCLLTADEKIKMCELVSASGADFIKTSTGFAGGGATREDIRLFKAHLSPGVRIKAAGGIATLKDAEDMLLLGADRLGTSRIVKLAKAQSI